MSCNTVSLAVRMERRVYPNARFLRYIVSITSKIHLREVLVVSSPEEIKTLLEIIANILAGHFAARIADLEKLEKYRGELENLWNIKSDIHTKKAELYKDIRAVQLVLIASETFIHELHPMHPYNPQ